MFKWSKEMVQGHGPGKMAENQALKNLANTTICEISGGSEGARTLDLLRDRQTL